MIVKGIVSAIDTAAGKISVILPEYDSVVTPPLNVYGNFDVSAVNVDDFVLVIFFNDDFADGIVLLPR